MADQNTGSGPAAGFGAIPGAEAMLASLASWTAAMPTAPTAMLSDAAVAETLRQAKALVDRDPLLKAVDSMWNANPLREVIPVDWAEVARALRIVWMQSLADPAATIASAAALGANVFRAALDAWAEAGQRWLGDGTPDGKPAADKRFAAPEWQANPVFRTLKEAYLLASEWLLKRGHEAPGLDPAERQRVEFHLRQFIDAMSPTLMLASNPVALKRAMETGGASLASGTRNLLDDLQAGRLSMVDETAFAPGRNLALTPGKVVHRNRLVELIQYAPQTETVHSRPILILPPWINKFYIMDMQPKNSLIGFLVKQGFTVFVVSWKNPDASMEGISIEDYMDLGVLETSDVVRDITGSETLNVMGYCIGGTLLAMVLAWLAAEGDRRFNAVTFMVSLQDFSRVGDTAVFLGEGAIDAIEAQMMQRGYLDSREMSNMFNLLRSNDLIWANVVNNYLLGEKPPAFDLLYWNSDGTRMARNAHAWYLRNTYVENNLMRPGKVALKGQPLDLGTITQDIYAVGAEKDHIVPWDAAWQISRLAGGKVRYILGSSGHIAGVINPPGGKGSYWTNDDAGVKTAEQWRRGARKHDGSWWTDWSAWLAARSGKRVAPPPLGGNSHPPLGDAPGSYVLEK
ncbi:PHA/PHB synthase family protein [Paracraurococcus lichenis]|uniref:Class I poly(R)-hydroxyalkanoic acid synthase n=1 Tax=Paracraurococcus lichenis TaxID=3064888 RepID=A0ABT9E476_9PROT|nr:class I poly(R)-hydroxyalkanoic acid synthase [Paracraurococcus sp. LOR1-02]MDO9710972.1 class I poly(R)-hydroxyalkanoic acid synthase [Paracraurococcus sp. LOR1-02]